MNQSLLNQFNIPEEIVKNNKNKLNISNLQYGLGSIMNDKEILLNLYLGVPSGCVLNEDKNGKIVDKYDMYNMSDSELNQVKIVYFPINTVDELIDNKTKNFTHYIINPYYMPPEKSEIFLNILSVFIDRHSVFTDDEKNKIQIELLKTAPINFEKMAQFRDKYITNEVIEKMLKKSPNRTKDDFNKFLGFDLEGGKKEMKITDIQIRLLKDSYTKALANVILDDSIVITNISVKENKEGNLYILMPQRKSIDKKAKQDELGNYPTKYVDTVYPKNSNTRNELQNAIINKYNIMIEKEHTQSNINEEEIEQEI